MNWNGSAEFLNRNHCIWLDSPNEESLLSNIQWTFTKYQDHLSLFPIYQCEMEGWGERSLGFSYSADHLLSVQKSFAEAWERLWFQRCRQNKNLTSSNGFAAGETSELALERSKQELIERQVLLEAWSTQSGWNLTGVKTLRNKFLILGMKLLGWDTAVYDIHTNIGVVKTGLIRHQQFGAYFDSTFCCHQLNAEEKIISSLFKYVLIFKKNESTFNSVKFSSPEEHLRFYANPRNLKAFNFLDSIDITQVHSLEIADSDKIKSEVIIKETSFPAVAYSYNPYWRKFCWGSESIQGANPWPQPLA